MNNTIATKLRTLTIKISDIANKVSGLAKSVSNMGTDIATLKSARIKYTVTTISGSGNVNVSQLVNGHVTNVVSVVGLGTQNQYSASIVNANVDSFTIYVDAQGAGTIRINYQ